MVRMRSWTTFGLSVSLLALCVRLLAQEPCTITVQPGESIQEAIDAAPEGAVICLVEGEWMENLKITKSLTLRGAGAERSVIRAKEDGVPLVRISSPKVIQVVVGDLRVTGAWGLLKGYGILVEGSAQATITGCTVSENGWYGILLLDSAQATISENRILGNGLHGVALYERPCFDTGSVFGGLVAGGKNTIPGPDEPDGNKQGAVCPNALQFLTTEEGGELDRREGDKREGAGGSDLLADKKAGIRLVLEAVVAGSESGQLVPLREAELDLSRRSEVMDRLVRIFSERLERYGMANAEVRLIGADRIEVLLPGASSEDAAAVRALFSIGLLEFRKVIDAAPSLSDLEKGRTLAQEILPNPDKTEWYLVEAEPLLTGDALDDAVVRTSTDPRQPWAFIALAFNREGAIRFVDVLNRLQVNDRLAVVLDGVVYSAPLVSASIKQAATQGWRAVQDSTTITGRFSQEELRLLATVLRSGSLPVQVIVIEEASY